MTRSLKIAALTATAIALAACGSTDVRSPVGTGSGYNELKTSPCACTEIPMKMPHGTHGEIQGQV